MTNFTILRVLQEAQGLVLSGVVCRVFTQHGKQRRSLRPVFFASLFLSLILTPLSGRFAHYVGAIDQPNDRSVHKLAMPRLGGLGMAVALGVSVLFFLPLNLFIAGFLAGLALIVAVGVADDISPMKARYKLVGQIASIILFIAISGYQVSSFGDLFGAEEVTFGSFAPLVTLLCMLGIMNAMNLSDGLDGLAGGITAIASLFFGALAIRTGSWQTLGILIALGGAVVGFLRYNSHPARMFMGDTGSLMLGYVLAVCCVSLGSGQDAAADISSLAPVTVAIVLFVPLFDALIVMVRRIVNKKGAFEADNTHLHYNLIRDRYPAWRCRLGALSLLLSLRRAGARHGQYAGSVADADLGRSGAALVCHR